MLSPTETKTNRAERPKEVTREGNDRVIKTEVGVTKVIRKVGFYAARAHLIGAMSLASEIKLGSVEASKRQGRRDEHKKILAELEKAGKLTPRIKNKYRLGMTNRTRRAHDDHIFVRV